jgi:hypothetical protein
MPRFLRQGVVMLSLLKYFRTAFSWAFFLFAVFWLPKDVEDSPQAAKPWQKVLSMIDQNTALWAFAICLLFWLFLSGTKRMMGSREFKEKWLRWRNGVVIEWPYSTKYAPSFGVDADVLFLKNRKRVIIKAVTNELVFYIDGTSKWRKMHEIELYRADRALSGEIKSFPAIRRDSNASGIAEMFGKATTLKPATINIFRVEIVVNLNGREITSRKEVEMPTYDRPTSRLRLDCEPELEKL